MYLLTLVEMPPDSRLKAVHFTIAHAGCSRA
jgi:hypothetical protein